MGVILVVGGSSGTGRRLVERLGDRPVRVPSRRPNSLAGVFRSCVEVVGFDLADPNANAAGLVEGVETIVFTAGVAPGLRSERTLRTTELDGLRRVADAAEASGFRGRFLYMTTLGLYNRNWFIGLLDVVKWNEVTVRREAEASLRGRTFATTVVRAGMLHDGSEASPPTLLRSDVPLSLGTRVARDQVAAVLAALLEAPALDEVSVIGLPASEEVSVQLKRIAGDG
jgi:uncharacterized protein YbjT (DUF2867 family)